MTAILTDLFGRSGTPLESFKRTEKIVAGQFAKIGVHMRTYQKAQTGLERERQKLQDFLSKNANLRIAEDTIENKVLERRLRNRKYFTIGADTLVSIAAIKLAVKETLGRGLTTPVALVTGCTISYFLLKLSIGYKNDDKDNADDSRFRQYWERYSYVIPLALIPTLSLFLVLQNPDSPANYLWIFFLVVAFLLNLKAASYSKQYQMMEHTVEARKEKTKLENSIESFIKDIEGLNDRMQLSRQQIEVTATELLKNWQAIQETNRPTEISLSPKYIFVLNNQIYFRQVLPIPPLSVVVPQGEVAKFENFWKLTTEFQQNGRPATIESSNREELTPPATNGNETATEQPEQEEPAEAPSFGTVINDTNKYV